MLGSRLIVCLALLLIFVKVQCVSACAMEACGSKQSVPPCHKHKQTSKICAHDVTAATVSKTTAIQSHPAPATIALNVSAVAVPDSEAVHAATTGLPPPWQRLIMSPLRV